MKVRICYGQMNEQKLKEIAEDSETEYLKIQNPFICISRLQLNSNLESLSLIKNRIGDEHLMLIVDFLKNDTNNLKCLSVNLNQITDHGAMHIAQVLKKNTMLKTLQLRDNDIGDQGVIALAEALKHNSFLENLDLIKNRRITDPGVEAMAHALEINYSLCTLEIITNTNEITEKRGIYAIEKALRTNVSLSSFQFPHCSGYDINLMIRMNQYCKFNEKALENTKKKFRLFPFITSPRVIFQHEINIFFNKKNQYYFYF